MLAWSALIFDSVAETLLSRLEWQGLVVSKSSQTVLHNARLAVGIEATLIFLALRSDLEERSSDDGLEFRESG